MSEPTGIAAGIADEQLDYQFLLLAHMVCADQQIHSEEVKALHELATQARIGENTLAEMDKILAQEENHLSVDELAKQVPQGGMQTQTMRQILAIAYVDGYFTPLEREMVDRIGQIWYWSSRDIQNLLEEAQGFQPQRSNDDSPAELSFAARLLKNEKKSPLSRAIINLAAQVAPET